MSIDETGTAARIWQWVALTVVIGVLAAAVITAIVRSERVQQEASTDDVGFVAFAVALGAFGACAVLEVVKPWLRSAGYSTAELCACG